MDELYDLQNDPREFHNLAGKREVASVERRLRGQILRWMADTEDPDYPEFAAAPGCGT